MEHTEYRTQFCSDCVCQEGNVFAAITFVCHTSSRDAKNQTGRYGWTFQEE